MSLPKMGDHVPIEKFHVSELNVRVQERFGECEEDKALIHQLWLGKRIIGPFKARPERDGYGVFVGRRRFLAKKASEAKDVVVGTDVIIESINEQEARLQSLIENIRVLRKEMDPIVRAQSLNEIISGSTDGLRGTARRLGIPPSTLSEWLKILELSPKMQEATRKGLLSYTEALELAREKLGEMKLDKMAETLEAEGIEAYRTMLRRTHSVYGKRGIPKNKYAILRIMFDMTYLPDRKLLTELKELIRARKIRPENYCKSVLAEHVKQVTTQIAK